MGTISNIFKKCKVPLCENVRRKDKERDWPICSPCMENTVRRLLQCENRKDPTLERIEFWIKHVCENIDDMVGKEQKHIDEHGEDYDRDKLQ